ncbi:hypothetical protein M430DRAFT_32230 [Amorphotheca resinae ATCC 22711]|uniref:Uncharacterized protein n=1 Tax=Amorphotheca resinae ATCC 22711 TaxID=857342 RepID=A0A2T3BDV9_AMORE|nr:hypothetical protein M430DRAFT_32230 [Amorphotheca resinae ATCC 22711]PSS27523.1 hypothetical protein M430DRAFT_32230 [Amorphotheca resinae ATCC 22711]
MAEPENFEEDLFADLYADDDTPAKQAPAPEVTVEATAPAEVKKEQPAENTESGNGDEQKNGSEQDGDDEIDFNLGNGNSYDAPAATNQQESHGPGIKEDG